MVIMPRIIIDTEKCKSCGICVETCPNKLIKFSNVTNKQGVTPVEFDNSSNKCTGCALCAVSCPEIAIKEVLR